MGNANIQTDERAHKKGTTRGLTALELYHTIVRTAAAEKRLAVTWL